LDVTVLAGGGLLLVLALLGLTAGQAWLVSHPRSATAGNWGVLIQAQGGYGNFSPFDLEKLVAAPAAEAYR
jgi:hypothetical protein